MLITKINFNKIIKSFSFSQSKSFNYVTSIAIIGYCGISILINVKPHDNTVTQGGDTSQYLRLSKNLADGRGFSLSLPNEINPKPTAHREPGWPAMMLLPYWLSPELKTLSAEKLDLLIYDPDHETEAQWKQYSDYLKPFLYLNGTLLLLTALIAAVTVKDLTKKFWAAWLIMLLISLHPQLRHYANSLWTEIPYLFWLTLTSSLIYGAVKNTNQFLFIGAGISWGYLILTRATFLYLIPLAILAAPILILRTSHHRKKLAGGYLIMITLASIAPCLWMYRNYQVFGYFELRPGGNDVFSIRAAYLDMNSVEYMQSFIYWTPTVSREEFYQLTNQTPGSSRLDRSNPNGFYRLGKNHRNEDIKKRYPNANDFELSKIRFDESLAQISEHKGQYLLSIIPFTYQGFYTDRIIKSLTGMIILNLIEYLSLISLVIISFRQNNNAIFLLLMPASFLLVFHATLTHNIYRYNIPAIPFFYIAAITIIANKIEPYVLSKIKSKSKNELQLGVD